MGELKIFNSLSNQKELFVPINKGEVSIYVCGPTVYQDVHFGNMRPVVVFDTLRRLLMALDYKVEFVSNITDVDDKIIAQAKLENKTEAEIALYYMQRYFECTDNLNALRPSFSPLVTGNIKEMINFIEELIKKDFAYQVGHDVYFRVNKISNYGRLSKINVDDLKVGARVEEVAGKQSPLDFVLWKHTDTGLNFNSPWGKGRPGWHTECVVLIGQHFNNQKIDIHGGGLDLKFPHHENELAQSQACHNHQLANYWMHNGFINIGEEKMSKSLGNVMLAKDLIAMYGGNAIRLNLLTTHYRSPLNFAKEVIESHVVEINKMIKSLRLASVKLQLFDFNQKESNESFNNSFFEAMLDDLNTPNAVSVVQEAVKQLNVATRSSDFATLSQIFNSIKYMFELLGLKYDDVVLTEANKELFSKWSTAKDNKDFALADKIRDELIKLDLI
jgi:cysteinyl-tRNA synthetase